MFLVLAGTSTEIEDSYHYLKKFKLTNNTYNNCICILIGVGCISSAFYWRQFANTTNVKLKDKIFAKLLEYMKEVNYDVLRNANSLSAKIL